MFECTPEKGRGTTEYGHPTDRTRRNLFWQECSVPGPSRCSHIKFWVIFRLVTGGLDEKRRSTSSGAGLSFPPSADILYAVVPASANDREGVGWVKARQRSEASSPEHRERSDRPRSDVSLVVSGSFKHTEQPGSFAPAQPPTTVTCILRRKPGLGSLFSTPIALLSPVWGCSR